MASIRNIGRVTEHVGVILEDGVKSTIRVMSRTRKGVTLPPGVVLDPNWMALYGQYIKLFEDEVISVITPSSSVPEAE